eukprot:scaffold4961_cov114-Isochrysis_galbana.AAC.15
MTDGVRRAQASQVGSKQAGAGGYGWIVGAFPHGPGNRGSASGLGRLARASGGAAGRAELLYAILR